MRILVVDDHRNTRDALALGLALLDVAVDTAGSGAEALRSLDDRRYDWLVCDVRMPGMTGVDLAARVRTVSPGIRLLLMTAYDVTADERQRIAELDADLLIKPVTAEAVATRCGIRRPQEG
jgi:CheY-like chemotaxis protein